MGIRLIKISAVYFGVGVLLGFYMSMTHSYDLTPVHVHINLMGWTALTLAGIIYHLFPNLSENRLGKWHFWLHNIGLPVMMVSLAVIVTTGNEAWLPGTVAGAVLTTVAVLLFVWNVLKNLKA